MTFPAPIFTRSAFLDTRFDDCFVPLHLMCHYKHTSHRGSGCCPLLSVSVLTHALQKHSAHQEDPLRIPPAQGDGPDGAGRPRPWQRTRLLVLQPTGIMFHSLSETDLPLGILETHGLPGLPGLPGVGSQWNLLGFWSPFGWRQPWL